MSTENNIKFTEIKAPELNDVSYAAGLNKVFETINNNFKILSNHDFVKGESGTSVIIKEYRLDQKVNNSTLYDQIKQAIENKYSEDALKSITIKDKEGNDVTVGCFDNLNNADTIKFICEKTPKYGSDTEFNYKIISSLYFVFLDGRFINKYTSNNDDSIYNNIVDASCALIYESGKFTILEAFPTMYYEKGLGLCWKLNGNSTGMPVKGLPGKDGINSRLFIVKGTRIDDNSYKITKIFNYKIGNSYDSYDKLLELLKTDEEYSAIIIDETESKESETTSGETESETTSGENNSEIMPPNYYFGIIKKINDEDIIGICDTQNPINVDLGINTIITALKQIDINDSNKLPGLFIPINENVLNIEGENFPAHLLSATSINNLNNTVKDNNENNDSTTELNKDLILVPVNDINEISTNDLENKKELFVNKYLYINVNKNIDILKNLFIGLSDKEQNYLITFLKQFNFVLKYKLARTIRPLDTTFTQSTIKSINKNSTVTDYDDTLKKVLESASIMSIYEMGPDRTITGTTTENPFLVKYLPYEDEETDTVTVKEYLQWYDDCGADTDKINNNNKLLSTEIINAQELYYWKLDLTKDVFDVEELVESINYTASNNTTKYNWFIKPETDADTGITETDAKKYSLEFINVFKSLVTTTINPVLSTKIYWFNGLSKVYDENNNIEEYVETTNSGATETTFNVLAGWNFNTDSLFSINKYVPIYKNDFPLKSDTAFDINYNVNITGDSNICNRNLSVQGGINCNDLRAHEISAEEIDKIYTKNNIYSTEGIYLGVNTDKTEYSTYITRTGEIYTNTVIPDNINCTDTISSNNIIQNPFFKISVDENLYPGEYKINEKDNGTETQSETELVVEEGNETDESTQLFKPIKYEGGLTGTEINKISLFRATGPADIKAPEQTQQSKAGMARMSGVQTGTGSGMLGGNKVIDTPLAQLAYNNGDRPVTDEYFEGIIIGGGIGGGISGDTTIGGGSTDSGTDNVVLPNLPPNIIIPGFEPEEDTDSDYEIENNGYISPEGETIKQLAEYQPVITSSLPYNSTNNTPIIVSNTDMSSQMLPANGIAKNYYDGEFEHPFNGAESAEDITHEYLTDVNFDNVTKFNVNRLSLQKIKELETDGNYQTYNSNSINEKIGYNTIIFNKDVISELDDTAIRVNAYTNADDTGEADVTYKFGYKKADYVNVETDIPYIHKVTLKLDGGTNIDRSKPIIFNLNKVYNILIGLNAKTSHGDTARLYNDSTYLKLHLYCKELGDEGTVISSKTIKLKYGNSSDYYRYSSGFGQRMNFIDDDNKLVKLTGSSYGDTYGWRWRFRSFKFFVDSFTINPTSNSTSNYNNIVKQLDANNELTFYIIPEYSLHVDCEDNDKVVKNAYVTIPMPLKNENKNNYSTTYLTDCTNNCGIYDNSYTSENIINNELYCNYSVLKKASSDGDINSTVILEDGIVFRNGTFTFGLGFDKTDNNPVLCYHAYTEHKDNYKFKNTSTGTGTGTGSDTGSGSDIDSGTDFGQIPSPDNPEVTPISEGESQQVGPIYYNDDETGKDLDFTKRIKTIKLTDLFDLVKWYKDNKKVLDTIISRESAQN